jgi:hypothetical protein
MAVVQHKDKDQAAGLQLAESIILCGHQAFRMHIKSTAVSVHDDDKSEVAKGKFKDSGSAVYMTRLEPGMSLLQVKASVTMWEKL